MNGSVFSKARYMIGVGFEILARTPVRKLPPSYPPPPPPHTHTHTHGDQLGYEFLTHLETYLYNSDPLKPYFIQLIWGLQGYTLFLLFLLKNIDCGYSLEPPRWGGSNGYHNLCLEQKCEKNQNFYLNLSVFGGEIVNIFE